MSNIKSDEAKCLCEKTRSIQSGAASDDSIQIRQAEPATKFSEIAVRLCLFVLFLKLENSQAFKRNIHPEEWWLYKNPRVTNDYVPAIYLLPGSFLIPFAVICANFFISSNKNDFTQSNLALTLSLMITGVLTSVLKVTVGRPRPDYFYRCYPEGGDFEAATECTGDPWTINEGRKSFPSGHSSFAFAGFGFIFLYLSAKLNVFNRLGRGKAWRLVVTLTPMVVAMLVAISRTCDYHHHYADVIAGSLLGFGITFLCYRQYFPSLNEVNYEWSFSQKSPVYRGYAKLATEQNLNDL